MTKRKKVYGTYIQLHTYHPIEGVVLIHKNSYDWHITPRTKEDCRKDITRTIAAEHSKRRILIMFKNGKQVLEKGLF